MENESRILGLINQSQIKHTLCNSKSCEKSYEEGGYWFVAKPIMQFNRLEKNSTLLIFNTKTVVVMKCRICGDEKKFQWEGGSDFSKM